MRRAVAAETCVEEGTPADALLSQIKRGGRVALAARPRLDPKLREDVVAASEEAAEQSDLVCCRSGSGRRHCVPRRRPEFDLQ